MKKTVILLLMMLMVQVSWAAKAQRGPAKIKQKDGTTLVIRGYGDEHFHYYTTNDGVLLYHEGYDYFIAKVEEDGSLSNTGILAHEKALRTEQEVAAIAKQDKEKFFAMEADNHQKRARRREPVQENTRQPYFPHTGSPKALVILAEFQDTTFWDSDAKEVFKEYLNANGQPSSSVGSKSKGTVSRNYGSVGKYFADVSFKAFTPQFDVYGPVKLSHKLKYYGEGSSDKMSLFIPEVCHLADSIFQVDFSQYDSNNDGKVDALCIIYAGYSEAIDGNSEDCIWPKSGTISGGTYDGKKVERFMVSAERNGTPLDNEDQLFINGIGVFCHEFSHCLGLPDFYPTTSTAQNTGCPAMEWWDLMDGGEYVNNGWRPTEYTAWEREAMEWMTIDTLKSAQKVTLKAHSQATSKEEATAYRIMNDDDPTGHEYIIVENIQNTGWNSRLPYHGMMITHVDYDKTAFSIESNRPNNEFTIVGDKENPDTIIYHPRYTLFAADGKVHSSYLIYYTENDNDTIPKGYYSEEFYKASMKKDLYPGPDNVTTIQEFQMYTGTMNKPFLNIKEENGIITFDFLKSTGIKGVKEEAADDNKIYSLDGTYMGTDRSMLKKGIYIINRKKIVIK